MELQNALKQDTTNLHALLALASVTFRLKDYDTAERACRSEATPLCTERQPKGHRFAPNEGQSDVAVE